MRRLHTHPIAVALAAVATGCVTTTTEDHDYTVDNGTRGSYEDSRLERLEEEAERYPKVARTHYEIAGIHFQNAEYEESAAALQRAIELAGERPAPQYHLHLGRIYMRTGELEKAEEAFRRAVDQTRDDRFSGPRAALGYVLALQGEVDAALKHLKHCIEVEPDNPNFYYLVGALHDSRHDDELAIRYFREYLDRGGERFRDKALFYLDKLGVEVDAEALVEARDALEGDGRHEGKATPGIPDGSEVFPEVGPPRIPGGDGAAPVP